jgi:hypothetical protein
LPGGEAEVQESPQEDLEDAQPEKSEEELRIEAEKAAEELKRAQEEALALVVQRLWRGHKARTLAKELRTKAMFDAMQAAAAAQGPKLSHVRTMCTFLYLKSILPLTRLVCRPLPGELKHKEDVGMYW